MSSSMLASSVSVDHAIKCFLCYFCTFSLGETGAILIGFLHVFFYTDYSILHKLFELFIQTVLPHENHVKRFSSSYPIQQC